MEVIVVKTQEEGALAAFEIFKRAHGEGAKVFGLALDWHQRTNIATLIS